MSRANTVAEENSVTADSASAIDIALVAGLSAGGFVLVSAVVVAIVVMVRRRRNVHAVSISMQPNDQSSNEEFASAREADSVAPFQSGNY
jgi:adenine/guanine phosphoribosyltransferase-like PRPP-binding protein